MKVRIFLLAFVLALTVLLVSVITRRDDHTGPAGDDFVSISLVPVAAAEPSPGPNASTGTIEFLCGRNAEGHRNSDEVIRSPRLRNGSHHVHDYVGNVSTDGSSTDATLTAAATTCTNGDRSTYYWPVMRLLGEIGHDEHVDGGGLDGNHGIIITPSAVQIRFFGSPSSAVVGMPRFLRLITGDAHALTNESTLARPQWTCSGSPNRRIDRYPLCPSGQQVVRRLEFPSCWNGKDTDSPTHDTHVEFPTSTGACPTGLVAVPRLIIEVSYDVPDGTRYAIDTFPDQRRSPRTDHAAFINLMSDQLMAEVVSCLNSGRHC